MQAENNFTGLEIAVIGMAGRFPGARDIDEFWENLKKGTESITFFTDEELEKSGTPAEMLAKHGYVRGRGVIEGIEYFDSSFFGYTPREAELMDPQMRVCLETTWHALENAGYNPDTVDGRIGFFVGASGNLTWEIQPFLAETGTDTLSHRFGKTQLSDKDFLALRVAYDLNLKGPAVTIYTACSTSLAAVDMATRSLLTGQCDMALAGGVTLALPTKRGYLYETGMLMSGDGHVRAFDALANGTNSGDGIGIVLLKPLQEAIAAGDYIHAVIKGSEVNNDGKRKVGFTAPSVEGQAEAIRAALHIAEVEPESINYIETHGTGTPLGDPIEIQALMQAFDTAKKQFCKIGSVKSNVGHLDNAAGIAGFIKTVQALRHQQIPPSLNFETPNPKIDFADSPFYVNRELTPWKSNGQPRRAGVSSLGIGGTNAFVVLEEAPGTVRTPDRHHRGLTPDTQPHQLVVLSAKTPTALERMTVNLAEFFKKNPGINLVEAAYTLHVGRKTFNHRKMLVCSTTAEALEILSSPGTGKMYSSISKDTRPNVVFMFAGQGTQYVNMGLGLYETEPVFRAEMERCFKLLKPLIAYDIKELLYPSSEAARDHMSHTTHTPHAPHTSHMSHSSYPSNSSSGFKNTEIAQLVIFIFEISLARLLMAWGIQPYAVIGYSFGEIPAACIAGILSLEEALKLVAARGQLMKGQAPGRMLSIQLPQDRLQGLLAEINEPEIDIAIDNGPSCIISGPKAAIDRVEELLKNKKMLGMEVNISQAMHSRLVEPLLEKFKTHLAAMKLNKPRIPFISNLTGTWLSHNDALDPEYWTRQMRQTVRYAEGITELQKEENVLFLEIGPGNELSIIVKQLQENETLREQAILNTVRNPRQQVHDRYYLLNRLGRLWLHGVPIDWEAFHSRQRKNRTPLPGYSFDPVAYPVEVSVSSLSETIKKQTQGLEPAKKHKELEKRPNIDDWFYIPGWKISPLPYPTPGAQEKYKWLVIGEDDDITTGIINAIWQEGADREEVQDVIRVHSGPEFSKKSQREYTIKPGDENHYRALFEELGINDEIPDRIVHLWGLVDPAGERPHEKNHSQRLAYARERVFDGLLYLVRSLSKFALEKRIQLTVVSGNMQGVSGDDLLYPEKALLLGPVKVIPREYSNIRCRGIDFALKDENAAELDKLIRRLIRELKEEIRDPIVAYRGLHRLTPTVEPYTPPPPIDTPPSIPWYTHPRLKPRGVYLVTGGLGGIGMTLAQNLAASVQARLILLGRTPFPPKNQWNRILNRQSPTEEDAENNLRAKIRELVAMEERGAEVQVYSADVANREQMQEVLSKAKEYFGTINGIVHAAGIIQGGIIQQITPQNIDEGLAAKVRGTLVLDELLREIAPELDFIILCSSLTALTGALGEVTYCAANAFLDNYALAKISREGIFTMAINWDAWKEVGFALEVEKKLATVKGSLETAEHLFKHAILPSEGVEVFKRALNVDTPRLLVSTMDLEAKLQAAGTTETSAAVETLKQRKAPDRVSPRPDLNIPYTPPANETERLLCETWEHFLGIQQVGIHDNFFELGANSLGIIQVSSILKETLHKEIPAPTLYAFPTVKELAGYIRGETQETDLVSTVGETGALEAIDKGKDKLKQRKKRTSSATEEDPLGYSGREQA